jgi:hypothetical protein
MFAKGKRMNGEVVWHAVTDYAAGWINSERRRAKATTEDYDVNFGGSVGGLSARYLRDDSNFRD